MFFNRIYCIFIVNCYSFETQLNYHQIHSKMIISVLIHGSIKSIKHKKNMFPSLFHGIEIGGIITNEHGFRTVLVNKDPKEKK